MEFSPLLKEIKAKQFKPIYLLHGEEGYFIDVLTDAIIENAMPEEERDFNQHIVYGKDIDVLTLISEAMAFPFMGERKLVVVKEAQNIKDLYDLERQLDNLNPQNILVICYKHKAMDGKTKLVKNVPKVGVNFKSEKVKDYQLTNWITSYVQSVGFDIAPKAAQLLADSIGNDLSRIVSELEKLAIVVAKGTRISEIHIEENIGISKEFNVFELTNAVATRDQLKAFQIADYFSKNPKDHSIIIVIPNLFKLFTNMMRVHFSPSKNPDDIARSVGLHPFVAKELVKNAGFYPPKVLARNVEILHHFDLKAKGVGNSTTEDGDLLREMLYQLMN